MSNHFSPFSMMFLEQHNLTEIGTFCWEAAPSNCFRGTFTLATRLRLLFRQGRFDLLPCVPPYVLNSTLPKSCGQRYRVKYALFNADGDVAPPQKRRLLVWAVQGFPQWKLAAQMRACHKVRGTTASGLRSWWVPGL
jgi:hypothetical protein